MAWSGVLVPLKDNPPLDYAGVYWNSNSGTTFGFEGITDGSSNTALFSETLLGSGPSSPIALSATTRVRAPMSGSFPSTISGTRARRAGSRPLQFMQACKACPGSQLSVGILPPANGNIWLAGNPGSSLMLGRVQPLHAPQRHELRGPERSQRQSGRVGGPSLGTTTGGGWGTFMDALPPSSNHPGGVNICFADGSVRFVKNQVTYQTWWAIGTRNGAEALSSDAY